MGFVMEPGKKVKWNQSTEGVITKVSASSAGGWWFEVDFGDGDVWSFEGEEISKFSPSEQPTTVSLEKYQAMEDRYHKFWTIVARVEGALGDNGNRKKISVEKIERAILWE